MLPPRTRPSHCSLDRAAAPRGRSPSASALRIPRTVARGSPDAPPGAARATAGTIWFLIPRAAWPIVCTMKSAAFLLLLLLAGVASPGTSFAVIQEVANTDGNVTHYKYTDKNGSVVFTDTLAKIPEEYRKKNKVVRVGPAKKSPAPPRRRRGRKHRRRPKRLPSAVPGEARSGADAGKIVRRLSLADHRRGGHWLPELPDFRIPTRERKQEGPAQEAGEWPRRTDRAPAHPETLSGQRKPPFDSP